MFWWNNQLTSSFFVKFLEKTATATYAILKEVYGHEFLSCIQIFLNKDKKRTRWRTMCILDDPSPEKWTQTFKQLISWSASFAYPSSFWVGRNRLRIKHSMWKILDHSPGKCASRILLSLWRGTLRKPHHPVLDYPPYSADGANCDFYLFQKFKWELKG